MSSKNHHKKRNAALLYEWLVTSISAALIDGDKKRSSTALKLLKKHFKPGTHLHKEFRLINSLVKTTVSSETVAASILREAKDAARRHDVKELEKEKTRLIHGINRTMDELFYDQQVAEYRTYATVQTLINDWRSKDPDLQRMAKYEDQLVSHLVTERVARPDVTVSDDSNGSARLLMKVLMKRFNEKYSCSLNENQKGLIRAYAFSTATDDPMSMQKKLEEVKGGLLEAVERQLTDGSTLNEYVSKKLTDAKAQLLSEQLDVVNDETVMRFMLYAKLTSELNDDGEKQDV